MPDISVILPTYNEEEIINLMVRETARAMKMAGLDYEIIVVDDGSTDKTERESKKAALDYPGVTVVRIPQNQGKGNAMKRGFQACGGELVCFIDADLEIHPRHIINMVNIMKETDADVVTGSKRHPDSELDYPRTRKLYSTVYYWLIMLLFRLPVKDTQTGIKLFRREVLTRSFPRMVCKRYTLDLELLVLAHYLGYRISEAPIRIRFHRGYKRITLTDIQRIIIDTLGIFYRLYVYGFYGGPIKPPAEAEPGVSIVIPTRSIDPMVEECVEKCNQLDYSNFDIKLITDNKEEIAMEQKGSRLIASGPVGPAVKRNMGVEDSDAELIAFLDADAWPDYGWLRNAVAYFEDEKVAAVGGPAVTPENDSKRQQASGLIYSATLVSGPTTYRYAFRAFREVDDYPTSNLIVRRSDFDAIGGFDLDYWPGEDTVFCWKLTQELGKKILYVPNVAVCHHRRPVYRQHLKQVSSYALHRGFFAKKFPETSRRISYFVPTILLLFVVLGLVPAVFFRDFLYFYLTICGTYLLTVLISSIKGLDMAVNLMVFPGIIATHVVYGTGLVRGLFSRRMKKP